MAFLVALTQFAVRLAVAVAVALVLALLLSLAGARDSFSDNLAVACLVIGCLTLLMAFAGHSPSARVGTVDPWLTSFAPKMLPWMAKPYSGTTLSTSALFALTAAVLFVVGFALGP